MESISEYILNRYPNVITYKSTKEIVEQMEKCFCKIKIGEMKATGFFVKFHFHIKIKYYQYLSQIIM